MMIMMMIFLPQNSQNEIIRSYDLIAVQAETERMFQVACATLDIDIITFDLASGRLAYPIRHGYVRQAIQRGITFELCYSGCIRGMGSLFIFIHIHSIQFIYFLDTASRRNAIGNASIITRTIGQCCRRGGGLIISSGAEYPWMIRYPHDVINLAGLYGVPAHLRHQCLAVDAVVAHAGTRSLTYRGAVAIVESEDESKMPPPSSKRIKGDSKNGDFSQDFIKFF